MEAVLLCKQRATVPFFNSFRRMLEYGTLQDHIAEILSQYNEGPKPGTYMTDLS